MTAEEVRIRKERLEGQRRTLRDQIMQVEAQLEQMRQNVCAFNGAIEECEYWLVKLLDEKSAGATEPPAETEDTK